MPLFLTAIGGFLKRLNLSQVALIAAVGLALFYRVEYRAEQRHASKLQGRVNELVAELSRISDARNVQKQTTAGTIAKADDGNKTADVKAHRIEAAPLPGGCTTPPAILGSDEI